MRWPSRSLRGRRGVTSGGAGVTGSCRRWWYDVGVVERPVEQRTRWVGRARTVASSRTVSAPRPDRPATARAAATVRPGVVAARCGRGRAKPISSMMSSWFRQRCSDRAADGGGDAIGARRAAAAAGLGAGFDGTSRAIGRCLPGAGGADGLEVVGPVDPSEGDQYRGWRVRWRTRDVNSVERSWDRSGRRAGLRVLGCVAGGDRGRRATRSALRGPGAGPRATRVGGGLSRVSRPRVSGQCRRGGRGHARPSIR